MYHLIAYNPGRGKFTAAFTSGTWEWDPATTQWTLLSRDRPDSPSIETKAVAYDPAVGMLYFATAPSSGSPMVHRFDYDSATWVPHGPMPATVATGYAEIYSAYDTDHERHLVSWHGGGGHLWSYDATPGTAPTAGAWTEITSAPQALRCGSDIPDNCLASFDYDGENHVFLAGSKRPDDVFQLWTYDPAVDEWRALAPTGLPPTGALSGQRGTMAYDPNTGRFYYVNLRTASNSGSGGTSAGDLETWVYRNAAGMPGDANCDGEATATDVTAALSLPADGSAAFCGQNTLLGGAHPVEVAIDAIFGPDRSGTACPNPTDTETTFSVQAPGDDATLRAYGLTYPATADSVVETDVRVRIQRSFLGDRYAVQNGLLRWDTSSLPDDATITAAWLRLAVTGSDDYDGTVSADVLELTAGWYDWPVNRPAALSDWTNAPDVDALGGATVSALTPGTWNGLPLTNFAGVSKTAYTALRLHVSQLPGDSAPLGRNGLNFKTIEDGAAAELIVCHTRP